MIIPVEYFLLLGLARRGQQASNEPMSTASTTTTTTTVIIGGGGVQLYKLPGLHTLRNFDQNHRPICLQTKGV